MGKGKGKGSFFFLEFLYWVVLYVLSERKNSPLDLSATATSDDLIHDTIAPVRLFWEETRSKPNDEVWIGDFVDMIHDALCIETTPGLSNDERKGETVPVEFAIIRCSINYTKTNRNRYRFR